MKGTLQKFGCWSGLLQALADGAILYYQAPLDRSPRRIAIARVFKNGKIRCLPNTPDADPFTADASTLDRFFWFQLEGTNDPERSSLS